MVINVLRRRFLRIAEIYFSDGPQDSIRNVDLIRYFQTTKEMEGAQKKRTLHILLNRDENKIFEDFTQSVRYEIRRASGRDNLHYRMITEPGIHEIQRFCSFYNEFAKANKLPKCNLRKLVALADQDYLYISCIKDDNGNELCYHAYIGDGDRARLLYSASHFRLSNSTPYRQLLGRANRCLHWKDILFFREHAFSIYDWGGITSDREDRSMWHISQFKRGFGGKEVVEYNAIVPKTIWGFMATVYLGIQKRRRLLVNRFK